MQYITITYDINVELLSAELRAQLPDVFVGVTIEPGIQGTLILDDAADDQDITTALAVVDAHDPAQLTPLQTVLLASADADLRAAAIPGWALWDEDQAIAYITANVTDLASAKVVLVAMARMIVALRDATWPALGA